MIKETFLNLPPKKHDFIIKKSHQLFNEKGYDNLTIKDIVLNTNISRGSFYQYFDSLYDVFYACILDTVNKKMSYMKPVIKKIGTFPFFQVYEEMIEAGLTFAKNHPIEVKTTLLIYKSLDPSVKNLLKEIESEGINMFESYLKIDQAQGFIDAKVDVEMLSRILYLFNSYELLNRFKEGASIQELKNYASNFLWLLQTGIN